MHTKQIKNQVHMQRFLYILAIILFSTTLTNEVFAQEEYFKIEEKEPKPAKSTREERSVPTQEREKRTSLDSFEDKKFIDRLRLGGSFGLSFGTYTNINISPMAGINLTEKLMVGAGVTYMYINSRSFAFSRSTSYYGTRALAMYEILPMVNLHAEYELLNVKYYNHLIGNYSRKWLSSPMVGGNYTQKIDGKFIKGIHMTVLYNLNYNNQLNPSVNTNFNVAENISPYGSPFVFRVTLL